MLTQSRFLLYWRAVEAVLTARRWPGLPAGRAQTYWLSGFAPELAADLEIWRASLPPRVLH
jgi:hypothetical protein